MTHCLLVFHPGSGSVARQREHGQAAGVWPRRLGDGLPGLQLEKLVQDTAIPYPPTHR